jgi:hypothetical protein
MNITRGIIKSAQRVVISGVPGIGKSTFASHAPNALVIDTEGSTKQLDVARFDEPTSWTMLMEEVDAVINNPSLCDTLIIDTIDWAEKLAANQVIVNNKWKSIEDGAYGSGYKKVHEVMGKLLDKLSLIVSRGVNVFLVAHTALRKVEQPDEMGSYDRWELKLQNSPRCNIAAMVNEWADMVLFANYKTMIVTDDKTKKGKGVGGQRVMYTTYRPAWNAKNRFGLPEECDFDYSVIAPYIPAKSTAPALMPEPVQTPTPAPVPEPTPAPVQPPAPAPAPVIEPTNYPTPEHSKLYALMREIEATESEVAECIEQLGFYPMGSNVPITAYPPDFIAGYIIPEWGIVKDMILKIREDLPF